MMHGAQIGARLPIGASTLTLAAHYYDLSASQGRPCRRLRSCDRQLRTATRPSASRRRHRCSHSTTKWPMCCAQFNTTLGTLAVAAVGRCGAEPGSRRSRHRVGRRASCFGARQQLPHLGGRRDLPDAGEGRAVRAADRLGLRRRRHGHRRLGDPRRLRAGPELDAQRDLLPQQAQRRRGRTRLARPKSTTIACSSTST